MKKQIIVDNGTPTGVLTFDMEDGKEALSIDLNSVSKEALFRLAIHGASQKIGDSAANAAKQENPAAWAREQVAETIAQLKAMTSYADWRATGTGGPRVTDLAIALSRITGKPLDHVVEQLDALDDEQKKVYRNKGKVKAELAKIAAEKAAEKAKKLAAAAEAGDAEEATDENVTI